LMVETVEKTVEETEEDRVEANLLKASIS
jgi:hypothetical protein